MKFLLKSSYNTQERPREQDLGEQFCPESSRAHREKCARSSKARRGFKGHKDGLSFIDPNPGPETSCSKEKSY